MKRFTLILFSLISLSSVNAQTYEVDIDAQILKNYKELKKGNSVHIKSMTHNIYFNDYTGFKSLSSAAVTHSYVLDTDAGKIDVKDKLESVLDVNYKNTQNFWDAQVIFNVLEELSKRGTQEDLRSEMESDVLEYISRMNSYGQIFSDPYLESYMYGLVAKIAPYVLIDGRPGNVNLLLLSDPNPNACMYPNGTLVITTGLLAILHSEDELAAVIAHEIAHFVLDHSVQNYNKALQRQKRAEFWAGFATVLTGVAEGVASANNPYYRPGAATIAVAAVSSQIAASVCERLGMKYSREQESEADAVAVKLLSVLKYDKNALSTALARIESSLKTERSVAMYFASDHPALVTRIAECGTPSKSTNSEFEKIVSFAVTDAASMKMQDRRFRQALPLFSQNINNKVATSDDYIQKANCLLYLKDDASSQKEVADLLNEAKKISPDNINIYKTEIISTLRQKNYSAAKNLLNEYKAKLLSLSKQSENSPESIKLNTYQFTNSEMNWVKNMIVKLNAF